MSRAEWNKRCAAIIVDCTGLPEADALKHAEAFEAIDDYGSPEEAANEEMSHWLSGG